VLDVLFLLSISRGLLQGFDDERGGGGDDGNGSLSVLDGKLYCDTKTFLYSTLLLECQPRTDGQSFCLTQSPVAFAMSSPTFFGDRPRGPIFGARADEAPTSPPVARRWLENTF
jgi:hypothetical protein